MGGQDHCCVINCSNRRSNLPKGFAFHQIPSQPLSRRNAWIRATGRKLGKRKGELIVTEHTKICGAHFVSGRKSNDPTNIDFVPSVNLPCISASDAPKRTTSNSKRAEDYAEAVQKATSTKRKTILKSGRLLFPVDLNDIQAEVDVESTNTDAPLSVNTVTIEMPNIDSHINQDHDYYKFWVTPNKRTGDNYTQTPDKSTNDTLTQTDTCRLSETASATVDVQTINSDCYSKGVQVDTFKGGSGNLTELRNKQSVKLIGELKKKVENLTRKNEELLSQTFSSENLLTCDKNTQFYTGLPNTETFNALFEYFKPKAERLTYWCGNTKIESKDTNTPGKGRPRKLTLRNEFFAVLVRLKLGLLLEDISQRLNISISNFSKIFSTWIRFLSLELQELFPYPSAVNIKNHLPESFRKFPGTRIILDCTEVFIQKPSALKAQRETWSSYKHRNTLKSLIGITPDGTVSFVSTLFGGAASDKFIVNNSGILDLIEPGDNVMADRGFEIREELSKRGAFLNIPPFRNGNFQLSVEQVETTRRIAEVRIHVERAIQRIKSFHILDGALPLSLRIVADDVFKTCAFLTNFQTPIIKEQ